MGDRGSMLMKASVGLAAAGAISKILGFVREMVVAARFGASAQVDAYVVASTVPAVLFGAIGAAVGTAIVPVFARKRTADGDDEAFRMVSTIWSVLTLSGLIVVLLGEMTMPWIVQVLAPGFSPASLELATTLGRIVMPVAFFTMSGLLLKGILHSLQVFVWPAFCDPAQNAIIIASIFLLGRVMGIRGLAMGTLLGSTAQVWLLWPSLVRRGFRPRLQIDWHLPELRELMRLVAPLLLASGIGIVATFVEKILASGLAEGSVAAMNYANRVYGLPVALLGTTLSTILYPTLAELASAGRVDRMEDGVRRGLQVAALALFPVAAGVVVLAGPITRLTYERGAFGSEATALTAGILSMYALGAPATVWRDVVGRAFYASGDTTTPLLNGVFSTTVQVVLGLVLVRVMGTRGLALSATASAWAGAFGLMWLWSRRRARAARAGTAAILDGRFWGEVAKTVLSTSMMSLVVFAFWRFVADRGIAGAVGSGAGGSGRAALLILAWFAAAVLSGAISYLVMARVLRVRELESILGVVRKEWRRLLSNS